MVIALEIQCVTMSKQKKQGRASSKLLLWEDNTCRFCRGQGVKAVPLEIPWPVRKYLMWSSMLIFFFYFLLSLNSVVWHHFPCSICFSLSLPHICHKVILSNQRAYEHIFILCLHFSPSSAVQLILHIILQCILELILLYLSKCQDSSWYIGKSRRCPAGPCKSFCERERKILTISLKACSPRGKE